jgi:tetratricopeptide (TPR) repeat protein
VLHARIVEVMEALNVDRLTEQAARLAHHALQGEVWEKALTYYRQAGDKAMTRSAFREAVACFEQALTALRHLLEQHHTQEQGIDLRNDLGNALLALGKFRRRFAYFREAETLAEALDDPRRLGQICTHMTHVFWTMGDYDNALTYSQRALTQAVVTGDAAQQARVHGFLDTVYFLLEDCRLGEVYLLAGRVEAAYRLAERLLALSRDRKERGNQAWALWLLGEIAAQCQSPDAAQAEAHYRQVLTLAEELGIGPLQAHCHRGLGTLYAQLGQREQAATELAAAIALYRAMAMTFWLPQTEATLARCCEASGEGRGAVLSSSDAVRKMV